MVVTVYLYFKLTGIICAHKKFYTIALLLYLTTVIKKIIIHFMLICCHVMQYCIPAISNFQRTLTDLFRQSSNEKN